MTEPRKYLYCIIPCQEERSFDALAIGTENRAVHTVCHAGLAAVVSDSPVKEFDSTRKNMLAHEKVLETVMKEYVLLPVRFGTVTDSQTPDEDFQRLLLSRSSEFSALLTDMHDKVELGLKAFWRNEQLAYNEVVAENHDIRSLRDSLAGKSPEATRFERIRLGEMVKEAMNRKRAREAARLLPPLRRIAACVRENSPLGDRMVLNAAFLVQRTREAEFDQAIARLDEELGDRLVFKYVGPVPPYNFVNVVVNWQEL